jgi:hypothetical protein
MLYANEQRLCKRLEHPQIGVSAGGLAPIPQGY